MSSKLCRICLCKESLHYIFEETNNLSEKIMLVSDVKVSLKDGLPQFICQKCEEKVDNFIEFKEKIKKTSAYLLSLNVKKETETIPNNNESEVEQYFDYLNNINVEVNILKNIALKSENKQSEELHNSEVYSLSTEKNSTISNKHLCSAKIKKKKPERPAQCNVCGKIVKSRFLQHMRIHTGERPFKCNVCGKGFVDSSNYKIHLNKHSGNKPYECKMCSRAFAQPSNLRAHMLIIHTSENKISCDICSKGFKTKSHFKLHMLGHTNEKKFPCLQCDKSFTSNHNLQSHLRTHTGEKPFQCTECGKHFREKKHLVRHNLIHTRNFS